MLMGYGWLEFILGKLEVASIDDKMIENHLWWFGRVQRRPIDAQRMIAR